ncbi:head-tail connector protein [Rhizobium nepotum]|uniref:head-tail connector protein n=1 Tax=Rhizobium nepotum TaxID=1035271 RepID=UPI003CF02210
MWYPPTVTARSSEPVSLDEAKKHLNVFHDDDDVLIGALIASAVDHVEKYTATAIAEQTIVAKCDGFADFCHVPIAPLTSVAISYVDTDGANQTIAGSDYELRADDLLVSIVPSYGKQWPAKRLGSRVTVTAQGGYDVLPPAIKHAALLWVADAYERRENAVDEGFSAFDALLCNFRRNL